MQSGLEVRLQHGALGGLYVGSGPAPGSVTTFGQLHRSKSKHSFYPKVVLKTEPP